MTEQENIYIDDFILDGVHYYRFYASCPKHSDRLNDYWIHDECGGDIYIGDDATFYCKSCGKKTNIFHASFNCPCCSYEKNFIVSFQHKGYYDVTAAIGGMIRYTSIHFLQSLLKNL